ncbi:MAG TPA: NlpC/P60 family protein [Pyrinomonadaceae bacterium]|nr:NlpC/P60 family protein [Pyrinomonadaceae bacterium]
MVTRANIVAAARAQIGVPFAHQGSDPATGLDCRGLVEWVAFLLWQRPIPPRKYQRIPSGREFREKLTAEMDEIPVAEARDGDVVLIKLPRHDEARHAGILFTGIYEPMIVHAFERYRPGYVREEPYRGWTAGRTVAAFRFRGVID